ncbi:hypothetical protein N7532_002213 [Penicillium argentinense]|uniref:Rhodopsin domain-containing protein n=1 Tax=Penicillium argentinense TaxID=1131581 RepID=A0A9W9G007_9EURO|nr:uncharacterized protein N7532_002213 [Penicillium argentinense]KAJ5109568.1 hypothetical protein N7532_002213 [Penicillium argentinense]
MNHLPQKRENLESISLVTQILCFTIVSPLIILRLFAKFKLHHPFGVEDAGNVNSYSTGDEIKFKIFYIATMFYVPMVLLVKTSLIYTLIRLWSPYRAKVVSLYIFLTILCGYYTIIFLVKVFTCNPIHLFWQTDNHDGTCLNRAAIIIADSVISVVTDLAILIFPIALTWTLHMPVSKKVHVIAILGAGSSAIAFSIYRLILVIRDKDTSHHVQLFMRVLLSDNAEGGLGLICTCIPAVSKLSSEMSGRYKRKHRKCGLPNCLWTCSRPARDHDEEGVDALT